jgi:hypothetical protein
MRLRDIPDIHTVRELGKMLNDFTYGICTVSIHKKRPTKDAQRVNPDCATCANTGITSQAGVYRITVTDRLAPAGSERRAVVFRGHSACRDALAYLLGRLRAKSHLPPAMRTRVRMWDEALRTALRPHHRHRADYHYYSTRGMADMRM